MFFICPFFSESIHDHSGSRNRKQEERIMVSVPKPVNLFVSCSVATPATKASNHSNNATGSTKSSLSPTGSHGSWKEEMNDLSKELTKICHSPINTSPNSPLMGRNINNSFIQRSSPITVSKSGNLAGETPELPSPSTNKHLVIPASRAPLAKRNTEMNIQNFPIPAVLVQNFSDDHMVLRVRHEESKDLLEKQLAMISGFKTTSQEDVKQTRQATTPKEMAAKVTKKMHESVMGKRFRTLVNIGDCPHEELMIVLEDNIMTLYRLSKDKDVNELRKVDIPNTVDPECLICNLQDQSLEIMEYPKKVIFTEYNGESTSSGADALKRKSYRLSVAEDVKNNMWKLVWHVPEPFQSSELNVKTIDETLVITCFEKNLKSGSNRSLFSKKGDAQKKQSASDECHSMKITVEIPENVEPKTVSAVVTKNKQLIIQGISSWRTRFFTY